MKKDKRLWIDGVLGSELKDTQGETLSVSGADITDLELGKGRWNDNHGKGFFNSLGTIIEAKKIFGPEDCENDRHKYYWEKIKAPYIYGRGFLHNDEDHPNAKAAAAIIRNVHKHDSPLKVKFSVEGGVVSRGIKDPTRLERTKIHSCAITFTPANNATLCEPLNIDKSSIDWESDKQLIKSVMHLAETNIPSFRHIERHASANTIYDNIHKIQELAKSVGVDIEIKDPSTPEDIMNQAVMHKITSNIQKINDLVKAFPVKPVAPNDLAGEKHFPISGTQMKANVVIGRHAKKAAKDPAHLDNIYNQLKDQHGHEKATAVVNKLKEKMQKSIKEQMIKALTAGYGGAGAPTNLTGGGVIQSESLDDGRPKDVTFTSKGETSDGISYISCDNCGHEQVYMKHQVKCRECNKNFSLNKLEGFVKNDSGLV